MTPQGIQSSLLSSVRWDTFLHTYAFLHAVPSSLQHSIVTLHLLYSVHLLGKCYIALPPRGEEAGELRLMCACVQPEAKPGIRKHIPLTTGGRRMTEWLALWRINELPKNTTVPVGKDRYNKLQIKSITSASGVEIIFACHNVFLNSSPCY